MGPDTHIHRFLPSLTHPVATVTHSGPTYSHPGPFPSSPTPYPCHTRDVTRTGPIRTHAHPTTRTGYIHTHTGFVHTRTVTRTGPIHTVPVPTRTVSGGRRRRRGTTSVRRSTGTGTCTSGRGGPEGVGESRTLTPSLAILRDPTERHWGLEGNWEVDTFTTYRGVP